MGPYGDGEDETAGPGRDDTPSRTTMSADEGIEALRRSPSEYPPGPEPGHPRGSVFSRWQVQVLIGVLAAVLVWPLAARDPGDNSIEATVAGETLERGATTSTTVPPTSSTTTVAAVEATTTVTAAPAVTTPPTTARPAAPSTTTTSTPTTTTTVPKPPKPIRRQSATQVFPGVQLTLTASAPESGEARTAVFRLTAEFGDTRVLRAARIDFGEGGSDDLEVFPWACWDAAAPNPYVLSDLSHIYPAGGTYAVTVTVRTASCVPGQNEPGPEATAELPLVLTIP